MIWANEDDSHKTILYSTQYFFIFLKILEVKIVEFGKFEFKEKKFFESPRSEMLMHYY